MGAFGQIKAWSWGPLPVLVYGVLPVKGPTYNTMTYDACSYATGWSDGFLGMMVDDSQKCRVRVILYLVNRWAQLFDLQRESRTRSSCFAVVVVL